MGDVDGAARKVSTTLGTGAKAQIEQFKRQLESALTTLGAKVVPILTRGATAVNAFVAGMRAGTGAGGKFASAIASGSQFLKQMVGDFQKGHGGAVALGAALAALATGAVVFKTITIATKAWAAAQLALNIVMDANPIGLAITGIAALAAGLTIAYKKSETFRNIVNGAWDTLKSAASIVFPVFKKAMQVGLIGPVGVIIGHFKDFKRIGSDAFGAIKTVAGGVRDTINGIKDAISGVINTAGKVKDKVTGFLGKITGSGDGFGKGGISPLPAGTFGGGLHGADPRMSPFAQAASRFGLGISAGRTDHSKYTTSGNLSWHGSGEALDFSNGYETPQELAFARYMASAYGGSLAELIHTPLGFGIKNGKKVPLSYWGSTINAQHRNHVHVAMDLGTPGIGTGAARQVRRDRYGPPWGGIQGGGTTATGVEPQRQPAHLRRRRSTRA
jgi:hypothetical protein